MLPQTRHGSKSNRKPFRARLTAVLSYDKQAKVHVGYAPGLNIYSQAVTKERAKRTLASAVELFLIAAQKNPALAAAVLPETERSQGAKAELICPTSFDIVSVIPT
jgi:hypothetical protein